MFQCVYFLTGRKLIVLIRNDSGTEEKQLLHDEQYIQP